MKASPETKTKLLATCREMIGQRIQRAREAMDFAQESANQETKSSAGDKYETGRAMMQRERDQAAAQLAEANRLLQALDQLPAAGGALVEAGSLVETNRGLFLLGIPLGQVKSEGSNCFAISAASPIGQELLGRSPGDTFDFRGMDYQILAVL